MEPLRKLRNLIDKFDYNHITHQEHKKIYQYIEREVLSPKSPIIKQVPPLEVVVYSIQNILYPRLAVQRIPDLLDLLATVEFYRKLTLDHAHNAVVWNEYYKTEKTAITLSDDDEAFLKNVESEQDSLRRIYIEILTTCCHLDMYLLWTASPPSMTDFLIRFNEYFPFLNEHYSKKSPRLFHSDLSNNERAQLEELGLKCCDLAQETVEWAMEYAGDGQAMHSAFRTQEFTGTFPRPCKDEQLSKLITYFHKCAASAAEGVQRIFSDGDS